MAIGISVSGSSILGFAITVTDATEGDRFSVTRTDNEGFYDVVAVRGADLATPTSSTMVIDDHEAPFNANITYTAASYDLSDLDTPINTATSIQTTTTEVPVGFSMLTQVFNAEERVTGTVVKDGLTEWSRGANVLSENKVLGRANPVIVTENMGPRKGTIKIANLLTHTTDFDSEGTRTLRSTELGKWKTIFENGGSLLFRNSVKDTGFFDLYFKCMSVTIDRELGGSLYFWNTEWPLLVHSIEYTEIDRPITSAVGLGLTGWDDVFENNVDWAEAALDHANWASVLANPLL